MLGEPRQVLAAPAERRQRQREHREPVVEVLAEPALAHRAAQVLVRRGEDPRVHGLVARAPEPAHGPLLEHLEQLGLEGLRQEPDLVEEDRAAVRGLEEAGLGAPGVGKGAALEAEHLRLEEGLGDRGAVDVHEGSVRARARPVEHPREEPLARAGLPLDQDRWEPADVLVGEQAADLVANRLDLGALTQQVGQNPHDRLDLTPYWSIWCSTVDHQPG